MEKSLDLHLQARALARALIVKRRADIEKTDEWKKARALGRLFARKDGKDGSEEEINTIARFCYGEGVFSLPAAYVWLDAQDEAAKRLERQKTVSRVASALDISDWRT